MNEKLKPCPFCGEEAEVFVLQHGCGHGFVKNDCEIEVSHAVICKEHKCSANMGNWYERDEAIAAWNRRTETGWIPCSERLPEKDEIVLMYDSIREEAECGPIAIQQGWCCYSPKTKVTHWMLLPEPPKEEGEIQNV